jgi:hypothetical protein
LELWKLGHCKKISDPYYVKPNLALPGKKCLSRVETKIFVFILAKISLGKFNICNIFCENAKSIIFTANLFSGHFSCQNHKIMFKNALFNLMPHAPSFMFTLFSSIGVKKISQNVKIFVSTLIATEFYHCYTYCISILSPHNVMLCKKLHCIHHACKIWWDFFLSEKTVTKLLVFAKFCVFSWKLRTAFLFHP